jgi:hypothetical protein
LKILQGKPVTLTSFRHQSSLGLEMRKCLKEGEKPFSVPGFQSGRLELVEGAYSPTLGEAVRFEYSDGHTPGQLLAEIGGACGVSFCSDLIPGKAWMQNAFGKSLSRHVRFACYKNG